MLLENYPRVSALLQATKIEFDRIFAFNQFTIGYLEDQESLAADLVEGVTDGGDDGGDEDRCVWVEHGGVVARQQALDERERVDLHVAVALVVAEAELDPRDDLVHVGGQGAGQNQDQFSQKRETSLSGLDGLLLHLPVKSLDNVGDLGLEQRHGALLRLHTVGVVGDVDVDAGARAGLGLLQQGLIRMEYVRLHVLFSFLESKQHKMKKPTNFRS